MIEWITSIDKELLFWLNQFHWDWLDSVMIAFSAKWVWIPLYAFLLGILIKEYKKKVWKPIVLITLIIVATDMLSTACKHAVGRLRPCKVEDIQDALYFAQDHCGGSYGFFSSHASNAFGLAMFMVLLVGKRHKWIHFLWAWAFIVSYSRVYLVVHYPLDITVGMLFGACMAYFFVKVSKNVLGLNPISARPSLYL